jgi:hypothetical protein
MRRSYAFLLIFALLSIKAYSFEDHDEIRCRHDEIEQNPEVLDIEEDTSIFQGRNLASAANMRMHAYSDPVSSTPSSYRSYVDNDLMPPIVSFFQGALKVRSPATSLIKTSSSSICGITTPSALKSGVSADYVHLVDTTSDSGGWVAESVHCSVASGTGRPLIGKTLLNRALLPAANGNVLTHEKNTYLMIHEMMHALGFSSSLYPKFIDQYGNKRTNHITSITINGKTSKVINVPSLTEKVRNHFGCSTLKGAVLENDGSAATAGSHFERKLFVYDAMTSGVIHGRKITQFNLGMLEASGWYDVDYSYAEPYPFGQGQGCTFVSGSCSSSSYNFEEFCKSSSKGCAVTGRGAGYCSSDSKADGCRYYKPSASYDCENTDAEDNARLPSAESYGRAAGSRCFSGTLSTSSSSSSTGFCFKYTCNGSGSSTTVSVQVGSKSVTCTKKGSVSVSGYKGVINCPDPLDFCSGHGKKYCPRNCMGRGSCINSKCVCNSGYKGIDCGLRA